MGLRIALFVMALLLSGAACLKSQAYFNETADLPCQFTNSQNISLAELVIFWQDRQNLVLYELYMGSEKPDNVAAKYLGRTSFDQDNWTVRLHNVQIKDQGSYQCFVHHRRRGELIRLFQMASELSVLANFSEPEIRPLSNITEKSGINLTCSSSQGYPQPIKTSFWLQTPNSTVEHDGVMAISQDNETELYNVSANLSIPFPDGTRNVTIICVIYANSMKIFSPPFNTVLPDPSDVKEQNHLVEIAFLFVVTIFVIVISVVVVFLNKRKQKRKQQQQQAGGSCEGEIIQMEIEETKERVKIHEPEQNDEEAQCIVVHYSKASSGNDNATYF